MTRAGRQLMGTIEALPAIDWHTLPALTRAGMAEVDRLAVDEFGIGLPQMMEQAGSHLAEVVRFELGGNARGRGIVIAVGPGNNGGGGLVAARHLANRGATVRVILARPAMRLAEAAREQLATLLQMEMACCVAVYDLPEDGVRSMLTQADLIVDAILGYNAVGPPHDEVEALIGLVDASGRPIVSLDLPSGLDPDTGSTPGGSVTASATMTLALPKTGLLTPPGREHAGRLYLADLGLPAALYRRLGLEVDHPFADGRIISLEG